jgi:hypothetical protein
LLIIISTVMTQIDVRQMRTSFDILTFCFAGLFLCVVVNRFEPNRPLATLLMILLLGITAAAVLKQSDALSAAVANGEVVPVI